MRAGTTTPIHRPVRAVTVAVLAFVVAACSTPATPASAPVASPEPAPSVAPATAPVGSPPAAGSPGADRAAAIRGSRVCIVNATAAELLFQAVRELTGDRTPTETSWTTLAPGERSCTAGYNACTAASLKGGDPYIRDACGYVRVPDGGPTFWFFAVNPWNDYPKLGATVDEATFFDTGLKEGGSASIAANGVTITGKREPDSDPYKEFTITVSR